MSKITTGSWAWPGARFFFCFFVRSPVRWTQRVFPPVPLEGVGGPRHHFYFRRHPRRVTTFTPGVRVLEGIWRSIEQTRHCRSCRWLATIRHGIICAAGKRSTLWVIFLFEIFNSHILHIFWFVLIYIHSPLGELVWPFTVVFTIFIVVTTVWSSIFRASVKQVALQSVLLLELLKKIGWMHVIWIVFLIICYLKLKTKSSAKSPC